MGEYFKFNGVPRCQHCKKENIPLQICSTLKNGRVSYMCRQCNTERQKRYRNTTNGRNKIYQAVKRSTSKFLFKHSARMKVRWAIKNGKMVNPNICSVCHKNGEFIEAHHKDYSKPLEVIWLCRGCHADLHK